MSKKHTDFVCMLNKALYGLKQAPRQWCTKINRFLIATLKFESSAQDPCLYVKNENGQKAIISLYVYDLVLPSNELNFLNWVKRDFCQRLKMEDCGETSICLGLEIRRDLSKKTLRLLQKRYAEKILERCWISNSKRVFSPMEGQLEISDIEGQLFDTALYRQAIGCIMYLAVGTRPYI